MTAKHPILLVDDEPEILFSLRGLLRKEFDLHTANSASPSCTACAAPASADPRSNT